MKKSFVVFCAHSHVIPAPLSVIPAPLSVIPAQAGILYKLGRTKEIKIPACAGMTERGAGMTEKSYKRNNIKQQKSFSCICCTG